jgi:hypothetical protein
MKIMSGTGLLLVVACSLSACGIAVRSRMEQSEDAYRQCLQLYPRAPSSCDELKKSYEQDKSDYEKP